MNLSIEVLENNQNKYVFCRIEVDIRSVFYYAEQQRPHRTHRWLSAEQWAAYDKKLKELLTDNKLDNVNKQMTYKLNGSLCVQLTNSKVSKKSLYNALNNKNINLADVVNVVDCKIMYEHEANSNDYTLTPVKIKVNGETSSLNTKLPNSEQMNNEENNEDVAVISCSNSSLISSSTEIIKNDSNVLPTMENTDEVGIKIDTVENLENKSPSFPGNFNENFGSIDKQVNETSTDSSDIAVRFLSKNFNLNDKYSEDHKSTRSHKNKSTEIKNSSSDILDKKLTSKDTNEHEKNDSDIQHSPAEKRKRKLYQSNEENIKKPKEQENSSQRHKLSKTNKNNENDIIECKSSKAEPSHKSRSGSATKKKKSHNEQTKSTCLQEKHSMDLWLGKKVSKHDENVSKSNSKDSSSSIKRNAQYSSLQKQNNSPNKKMKPLEQSFSSEEQVSSVEQNNLSAETDRKLIECIKQDFLIEPTEVPILDLMKMPANDLLATYEEYRPELEKIFKLQKCQKKFTCIDGVNHYLVINLVTNKVQQKLMAKLSEFEKCDTPKYGDLFSMVLMPEWILRVFMAKFKMSRSYAIEHIKAQNDFNALKAFPCEKLVQMASKK